MPRYRPAPFFSEVIVLRRRRISSCDALTSASSVCVCRKLLSASFSLASRSTALPCSFAYSSARRLFFRENPSRFCCASFARCSCSFSLSPRSALTCSSSAARGQGNVVGLMFELTNLALLDLRTGYFVQALAGASEVAELATETGNDYLLACNLAVLTRLAASRGDLAAAQAACPARHRDRRSARRRADQGRGGDGAGRVGARRRESGGGRKSPGPLRRLAAANEIAEPSVLPFAPDLIEAYVGTGRRPEARTELEHLEGAAAMLSIGAGLSRPSLGVAACWRPPTRSMTLSGWRSSSAGARVWYALPGRSHPAAFWGTVATLASPHRCTYAAAQPSTHSTGSARLAGRSAPDAELEATGETIARRDPTAPEKLTPQELQIALQVAEGKSNRRDRGGALLEPQDSRVPPDTRVSQAGPQFASRAHPVAHRGDTGRDARRPSADVIWPSRTVVIHAGPAAGARCLTRPRIRYPRRSGSIRSMTGFAVSALTNGSGRPGRHGSAILSSNRHLATADASLDAAPTPSTLVAATQ